MAYSEDEYLSIKLTRFFMRVVGFWYFENRREELILKLSLAYTLAATIFATAVETTDLFYCWGDFNAVVYNACATIPIVLILIKISVFIIRRDLVINLIGFSIKHFWRLSYDDFGKQIMRDCDIKGVFLLFTFFSLVCGTIFSYLLTPIVENMSNDSSDRILPFKIWFDLPLTVTPYYEIAFLVEALSSIHIGICFFCFDNLMCVLIIHTVAQFKILQHRLQNLCEKYSRMEVTIDEKSTNEITLQSEIYYEFKSCVDQHRTLINHIDELETLFNFILLCQMILSSILLCLTGFQVFLSSWNIVRRLIFISHMLACSTQILLFTWTCNEIILESRKIGDAAYHSEWYTIPHHEIGISLKQGLLIVMARVNRPCFLSAGKFCPMSLQAFTSIFSTALSYFTLLRQMSEEEEN